MQVHGIQKKIDPHHVAHFGPTAYGRVADLQMIGDDIEAQETAPIDDCLANAFIGASGLAFDELFELQIVQVDRH